MKKSVIMALLVGLAGGVAVNTQAAEAAATRSTVGKPTVQQLAGRVVAVDKKSKTVTIEVNGKTYVLQLDKKTRVAKSTGNGAPGKEGSVDDIKVGEDLSVTVQVTEQANGQVEVAVLSVETQPSEAAGKESNRAKSGPPLPFPGNGTPNAANTSGNVVSPNN